VVASATERGRGAARNRDPDSLGETDRPDCPAQPLGAPSKRGRSESPGDRAHILRRLAPNESLYAWADRSQLNPVALSPNLELTRRMVLNHGTDIKNAKLHLLSTPGVPRFPDGEWGNVLLGKLINLDVVLSGAYATHDESQTIEHIGDIELRHGTSKPAKSVQTSSDWTFAWGRASSTVQFVFPHRATELARYTEYIGGLFGSKRVESHWRVIDMDKAI